MSLTSTATEPTVRGLAGNAGIPTADNIVYTCPMAASASVSKGDFVKLTSTTAGTVEKMTATSDTFYGIAEVDMDNTDGAAADLYVPILKKGHAEVDARVTASGDYDEPIRMNDIMYLCGSAAASTDIAQKLTSTNDSSTTGTAKIARALDSVATPTTTDLYKIRVYIDTLTGNLA